MSMYDNNKKMYGINMQTYTRYYFELQEENR
jgi:hypothetical protein